VFVNLYLPSTLRWISTDGAQLALTQTGDYPLEDQITMHLRASRPSSFALRLRIPAWSSRTELLIQINGERVQASIQTGFATVQREWKDGDRIELKLVLPVYLESIDSDHQDTVALLRGPLVLFAVGSNMPGVTRQSLLSAVRLQQQTAWRAETASGPVLLRPFFAIRDEHYSAYVNVT
ncbi:MAG: glycoside hydrolase family 127 protein, partial [Acidobacteriaceae bacterium]|nr:glycoside hydrolase family 127 protein [Acidobacteriaceae bacterium]